MADEEFERIFVYENAEAEYAFRRGVWRLCGGDFHLTPEEEL